MAINEHLTEFVGLPVVEFLSSEIEGERLFDAQYRARRAGRPIPDRLEPDEVYAAALADPGTAAWRLRVLVDAEELFEQYFARFLAEVDTTKVTALIVGCWGENYEDPGSEPRDLLIAQADRFPALRSLGLRNSPWGDDLVRALAGAPVLDRVKVLDLSGHVLTDAGGEVLATAPVFRTLDRLVLHHHFLTEPVLGRVREALAAVDLDLSDPEEPDHSDDDGTEILLYYPEVTE